MSHTHTTKLDLYKPNTDDTLGASLTGFNANSDILDESVLNSAFNHANLANLTYAAAGHTGFEPTVTKGNLTAGSTKITIGGTGTGAVIGAGATVDVAEANINHDALTNYSANKHVDHTGVTLTAGVGLSGGGDVSANRTFTFDATELESVTWGGGAQAAIVHTFAVSGTDTTMTYGNAIITASCPFSATTGFQIGGAAAAGTILRGNGTNFVASTFTIPDTFAVGSIPIINTLNTITSLTSSSGTKMLVNTAGVISFETVTGTGAPVLATSPALVTPTIGVATGTRLTLTGVGNNDVIAIIGSDLVTYSDLHVYKDAGWSVNFFDVASSGNVLHCPQSVMRRARNTIASPQVVANGDQIGTFGFRGYDGAVYLQTAIIAVFVDAAVTLNNVPMSLSLRTGTTTPIERLFIGSDGGINVNAFTTAGFVKNSVAGLLSGGNSLAIADIPVMTSLEFSTKISDETGSGAVVFGTSPTINEVLSIVGTGGGFDIAPRDGSGDHFQFYNPTGDDFRLWNTSNGDILSITSAGTISVKNVYPYTDNTYYLGKNSISTPVAWKAVCLKDTTNGNYYRLEITNGVVTATQIV